MYYSKILAALLFINRLTITYAQKVVLFIDVPMGVGDQAPSFLPNSIQDFTYAAADTLPSYAGIFTGKLQLGPSTINYLPDVNLHTISMQNNIATGHFGLWPFKNNINITQKFITDDPYQVEQQVMEFAANKTNYFITIMNPYLSEKYLLATNPVYNPAWHNVKVMCTGRSMVKRSDCSKETYSTLIKAKNIIQNRTFKTFIKDGAYVVWMPVHGPLSDHTDYLYDANNPYRGEHKSLYYGGIKGKALYSFPNRKKLAFASTANGIDLPATLMSIFNIQFPNSDGINLFNKNAKRLVNLKWFVDKPTEGNCINSSPQYAELRTINSKQYIVMYDAKRKEIYSWSDKFQFKQAKIKFDLPNILPKTSFPGCSPYPVTSIKNGAKSKKSKPSVVFMLLDDVGPGDIMQNYSFGNNYPFTPNINKLRQSSLYLANFFTSTTCSPSRSAAMSGAMPKVRTVYQHSLGGNADNAQPSFLGQGEPQYFMSTYFKAIGYTTLHFGKCHWYDPTTLKTLDFYHFDRYKCHSCFGPTGTTYDMEDPFYQRHSSEIIVNDTLAAMSSIGNKPFFANIWFSDMHSPFNMDEDQLVMLGFGRDKSPTYSGYRTALFGSGPRIKYNARFTYLDQQIGRVVDWLEKNRPDNHIIVLTADNSAEEETMFQFSRGDKGNERGQKRSNYGATLPAFIKYGDAFTGGTTVPAAIYDIFPTLVGLTGNTLETLPDYVSDNGKIYSAQGKIFDGVDLSSCLYDPVRCKDFSDRVRYLETTSPSQVPPNNANLCLHSAPRFHVQWDSYYCYADSTDHGDIKSMELSRIECYNKSEDQLQTNNIASDNPDLVDDFKQLLFKWPHYDPQYLPKEISAHAMCKLI